MGCLPYEMMLPSGELHSRKNIAVLNLHLGGCQNYGPLLDPYYNSAPKIKGTQKGTIVLTAIHLNKCNGMCKDWH